MRDGRAIMRGGRALMATSSSSCCCGSCPWYWKASLCNQTCAPTTDAIYVCSSATCPAGGSYSGPLVEGTIVKVGAYCYRISTATRYCPPGTNRPHCVVPPERAEFIDVVTRCESNCEPPTCQRFEGYYKMTTCSNTLPGTPPRYVCCASYDQAKLLFSCPVFRSLDNKCHFVKPGEVPIPANQVPPGAQLLCPPTTSQVFENCCKCAGVNEADCCLCTTQPALTLFGTSGNTCVSNTTLGSVPCESWAKAGASISGCGFVRTDNTNGCPLSLACYSTAGPGVIRETVYQFAGDCSMPGNTNCPGGCPGAVNQAPLGPPSITDFPIDSCSAVFGPILVGPPGVGTFPCCTTGQELVTCRSYQLNAVSNVIPCGGQRVTYQIAFSRTSATGVCGDDACGGGLLQMRRPSIVRLDGTDANDGKAVVVDGDCSTCGKGQQRTPA
jgi:hypothetical protein